MSELRRLLDLCFRDREGQVVIAQYPNWPLGLWALASVMEQAAASATVAALLGWTSFAAIAYWSWLEIASGVNYFRRGLGLFVLAFVLYNRFGG